MFQIIENVLQRTKVCHIRSSRDLIRVLRELVTFYKTRKNNVSLEEKRFPLVIIDSLPAVIFKVLIDKFLLLLSSKIFLLYFMHILMQYD